MAKTPKPDKYRRDLSSTMLLFVEVLDKNSTTCVNPEVIKHAANMCGVNKPDGQDSWGYEIDNLHFRVKSPQKVIPAQGDELLNVHLGLKIEGKCIQEFQSKLTKLELSIVISTEGNTHLSSWHFDQHITSSGSAEPHDAHPLYHFQYGGKKMAEISEGLGNLLLLPAPRIGHPPMDIVLAVDFVLSNFSGEEWNGLREVDDYRVKVANAQEIFWKPYMEHIMSWWEKGNRPDRKYLRSLWPHLI